MQEIEIVRGTTNVFVIMLTDATGTPYTPGPDDRIVFGVKKLLKEEPLQIVKTAAVRADGSARITIEPEDTKEMCCDKYFYDVGLQAGENFYNIIPATPFRIANNVTFKGCENGRIC